MTRRIFILGALLLAGMGACTLGPPSPSPSPQWRVEVAGCETWQTGPSCALPATGPGQLVIWVGPQQEEIEIHLDGQRLRLPFTRMGEGMRIELEVAAKAEPRILRLGAKNGGALELKLVPSRRPGWYAKFYELQGRDRDGAEQLVAAQREGDRAWKTHLQARLELGRGRRSQTRALLEQSTVLWRASEVRSQEVNDAALLAQLFADDASYPESRQALADAERALVDLRSANIEPVRPVFLATFAKAHLDYLTGDLRGALAEFDALEVLSQHGVLSEEERSDVVQLQAIVLGELGQFDSAAALLDGLPALANENQEARRQMNSGWVALLERQAGRPGKDPRPFFEAAWAYYSRQGTDNQKLNSQINLAATALLEGRPEEARRCLEEAARWRDQGLAIEKFMFDELKARLLLAEGQKRAALEAFERLDEESVRRHLPGARWQALVGKAEALARLGRKKDARATYAQAEQLARSELLLIPFHRGRETFLARREKATREHLELLLEEGYEREAFELLRQYRTGALAFLERDEKLLTLDPEARRRWDAAVARYHQQLAALEENPSTPPTPVGSESRDAGAVTTSDTSSAIFDAAWSTLGLHTAETRSASQPGELQLAFFPREHSWLIFALDGEGRLDIEEKAVAPGTGLPAVAADLLQLVAPQIKAAEKLKILPWGDLDFHALPFEGKPLLATKKIAYGVDTGGASASPTRKDSARSALLVGNPTQNLLWTGVEIELALETLGHLGTFAPPIHLIGIRARGADVREALEKVDFFHFAGHGFFDRKGGQSRLSLSGGELRVGDVLTLRQAPEQVLLSSCSVGRATRASGVEGLGLANAFVLAGSRQVLAATREVDDRQTAELARSLYRHIAETKGEIDLVAALQKAQLEWIATRPMDDAWKAFRVFEP